MKIKELIKQLEAISEADGNLDICIPTENGDMFVSGVERTRHHSTPAVEYFVLRGEA